MRARRWGGDILVGLVWLDNVPEVGVKVYVFAVATDFVHVKLAPPVRVARPSVVGPLVPPMFTVKDSEIVTVMAWAAEQVPPGPTVQFMSSDTAFSNQ